MNTRRQCAIPAGRPGAPRPPDERGAVPQRARTGGSARTSSGWPAAAAASSTVTGGADGRAATAGPPPPGSSANPARPRGCSARSPAPPPSGWSSSTAPIRAASTRASASGSGTCGSAAAAGASSSWSMAAPSPAGRRGGRDRAPRSGAVRVEGRRADGVPDQGRRPGAARTPDQHDAVHPEQHLGVRVRDDLGDEGVPGGVRGEVVRAASVTAGGRPSNRACA